MSFNISITDHHIEVICKALFLLQKIHVGDLDVIAEVVTTHPHEDSEDFKCHLRQLNAFITGKCGDYSFPINTVHSDAQIAHDWYKILAAALECRSYQGPMASHQVSPTQIKRNSATVLD